MFYVYICKVMFVEINYINFMWVIGFGYNLGKEFGRFIFCFWKVLNFL